MGLGMNNLQSYVYAINARGTNRYKVGTTTDLKGRLAGVQTGCPYPAEIVATWVGDRRLETALHRELAAYRRVGEWFEIDDEWIIGWKVWRIMAGLANPLTPTEEKESARLSKIDREEIADRIAFDKKAWKMSRLQPCWLIKRLPGHNIVESECGVQYLYVVGRKPDRTSADTSKYPLARFLNWESLIHEGLMIQGQGSA